MVSTAGRDWRSLLLITASGAGVVLALSGAAVLIGLAVYEGAVIPSELTLLDAILTASALILIAAMLLPSVYYSLQRLRGRPGSEGAPPLIRVWQVVVLIIAWAAALLLAGLFYDHSVLRWFTPPLYLLSIGLPVYCLTRLATGGLAAGSRQRAWGVFGISMLSGPMLALLAEAAIGLLVLVGTAVYVALNPGAAGLVRELAEQVRNAGDMQSLARIAGPYLDSPLLWLAVLIFLSVLTPIIEETAKSMGVWLVSSNLRSTAEGFALGALSGAGFGLVESLLVSATPDPSWGMTLAVRGASSMMHIFTASLTGWGIASARLNKKAWHALAAYAAAMLIHGLWNAAAVGMVFGALDLLPGLPQPAGVNPLAILLVLSGLTVLAGLVVVLPIALGLINWQMRKSASAPEETAAALPLPPAGEAGIGVK